MLLLMLIVGAVLVLSILSFFILWICRRRLPKRFLFVLVCMVTLIALAYAEEDWRGKYALDKFKRDWEAKGEKFTFKELLPPPVPEDENFALTPVIASCYEAVVDKNGRPVKPSRTDVVNRLQMSIEGPNWRNVPTNADWANGTLTDLTQWQQYYRALAATTNLFPVPREPTTPAADVLFSLNQYDATIEEIREASQLPYARFPLEYDRDNPSGILLPHLAALKSLSRTLQLRSLAELQNHQSDKSFADVKLSLYLGNSLRTEPFLISHLVRIAMLDITLQPIYEGLAHHQWSDPQLVALDTELTTFDFIADFQYSMRGERILGMADIDYFRRARDFSSLDSPDESAVHISRLGTRLIPAAFFYQNELAIGRMEQEFLLPMADPEHRLISPSAVRQMNTAMSNSLAHFAPYKIFARMTFPALKSAIERFAVGQCSVDLARTAIALERFRLAHGDYPDTLDALTPGYIDQVPHDIINGQPLKYRRTDDGQFLLYSVGWNETDNNGQPGLNNKGHVNFEKGDLVWRYPTK